MPYNPGVQDISGQLLSRGMEQAALMRSQAMGNIGTGIANAINVFQKRKEEEQDFMAKAKSMESFIKSHADDFAPVDPQTGQKNPDAVLQFLQKNPDESTRQYYMKLGTFLDTAITGTKMQKEVAATRLEKARADTAEAELKDIKDAAKWNQTYGNVDVLGNLMGGGKPAVPPSGAGMPNAAIGQPPVNAAAAAIAPNELPAITQYGAGPTPQRALADLGGVPAALSRFAPQAVPSGGPASLYRFSAMTGSEAPTLPSMIANQPALLGSFTGTTPGAIGEQPAPVKESAVPEETPAGVAAAASVSKEAPKMQRPTVNDARLLAQQWNQGRRPTGPQVREAQEWLQKQFDATTKETHLTERDKAYNILKDAFVQNNDGREPNAQEKSELLQRAATIGTVGFAAGMPFMNPDGSFAGISVQDKKTGDVKLMVPGQEGLFDIPKGATPATQGSFTKSILPITDFQKLTRELTEDEIALDKYSKYIKAVGGARQGIDMLSDQISKATKTLFNNGKLTQEQLSTAMANNQLQGLIGAMRLSTVGGGVMTEKDAERVIMRLGGDVNLLQNKEEVRRAIADAYAEKYKRYKVSLNLYNNSVKNYYGNQGFSEAKAVEFDPQMMLSGSEMYGMNSDEQRLAEIEKRQAELRNKAQGGKK